MELIVILTLTLPSLAVFAVRARRAGSYRPFVEAGMGVGAGVTAGVLWGIGARIAMRAVALADGGPTEFTIGGTLLILFVGALFGIPLGLLFAAVRRWLPGSGRQKGLAFGGGLLALLVVPFALLGAGDIGGDVLDAPVLIGTGLFASLFVGYGLAVEAAMDWIERRVAGVAGAGQAGKQRATAAG